MSHVVLEEPSLLPRTGDTPRLDLDVCAAVAAFARLAASLPGTAVHYAVKANPHPVLLRSLHQAGCRFDVASPAEVRAALGAGARPETLVYPNPVKKRADIAEAVALGVSLFVVDSPQETRKVAETAPGSSVLCRLVTSGAGSDWPLSRKYGVSTAEALEILLLAAHLGLAPAGISFHVGSQQRDPGAWATPVAASARVFADLRDHGLRPRLLDLGVGFPARLAGDEPAVTAYGAAIRAALASSFGSEIPETLVEPGRGIVGDAGTVVTTVIEVIDRGGTRWVFLDCGVFTGLVETLEEAIRYPLRTAKDGGPVGPCVVSGPTCDSADVLYQNEPRMLPLDLAEGDEVRIDCAGAYSTCYSTVGFNGFDPLPTELAGGGAVRTTTRILVSHALAAAAMGLAWPLLLALVWEATGSGLWLGIAAAARMAPYVLCSWWVGQFADRHSRSRIVHLTLAARALLIAGSGLALGADLLTAAVVLSAGAVAVSTPAYPALVSGLPKVAGATPRTTEWLVTIEVSSFVVGPAVGGLLLADAVSATVFPVAVGATLLASLVLRGVSLPAPQRGTTDGPTGWTAVIARSPQVRRTVAVMAVINIVLAAVGIALLPLASGGWSRPWSTETAFGIGTAVLGFGALGAPLLMRLGRGPIRRTVAGLVLMCAGIALLAAMPTVLGAVPALALVGAAAVHAEGNATRHLQGLIPDESRASVFGAADTAMVSAALVGSLTAPLLAELLGPRVLVGVRAVVSVAVAGLILRQAPVRAPLEAPAAA